MTQNQFVRARINKEVKEKAKAVLASIGLTVSDAIRFMMIRIAEERVLPFDPLIPSKETINVMEDKRHGQQNG